MRFALLFGTVPTPHPRILTCSKESMQNTRFVLFTYCRKCHLRIATASLIHVQRHLVYDLFMVLVKLSSGVSLSYRGKLYIFYLYIYFQPGRKLNLRLLSAIPPFLPNAMLFSIQSIWVFYFLFNFAFGWEGGRVGRRKGRRHRRLSILPSGSFFET